MRHCTIVVATRACGSKVINNNYNFPYKREKIRNLINFSDGYVQKAEHVAASAGVLVL